MHIIIYSNIVYWRVCATVNAVKWIKCHMTLAYPHTHIVIYNWYINFTILSLILLCKYFQCSHLFVQYHLIINLSKKNKQKKFCAVAYIVRIKIFLTMNARYYVKVKHKHTPAKTYINIGLVVEIHLYYMWMRRKDICVHPRKVYALACPNI